MIRQLTLQDYTGNNLNVKGYTIVLIHGSFCGHCKSFAPIFQQFGQLLQQNKSPIQLASIQIDSNNPQEAELGQRIDKMLNFHLKGVPTLLLYGKNGGLIGEIQSNMTLADLTQRFLKSSKTSLPPQSQFQQPYHVSQAQPRKYQ